MLTIELLGEENFDDAENVFVYPHRMSVDLEHSLAALSKWESIHKKPFLSNDEKTPEELLDYIRCMMLTPNVPDDLYDHLSEINAKAINDYINDSMTATWITESPGSKRNTQIITSELIYSWMVGFGIDFECQHWHLNRLIMLIRVMNTQNEKPKKMSRSEQAAYNRELNRKRREKSGSTG